MTDLTLSILLIFYIFGIDYVSITKKKIFLLFLVLVMIMLFGLRHYSVGVDSTNYAYRYETLYGLEFFEIGFVCLIKFLHYILPYYPFFFFVTAAILWVGLVLFYKKYTNSYWIAIFLFCALGGVNTILNNCIRQGIAIILFLSALNFALNKKIFQYFIIVSIAFLFHKSALIAFPLYFLIQIEFKYWKIFPFLFVFLLLLFNVDIITKYLFVDYARYLRNFDKGSIITFGKIIQLTLISFISIFSIYTIHTKKKNEDIKINNMLLWFVSLYLLCSWVNVLPNTGRFLSRISWYFYPFVFIPFCHYLDLKSNKGKIFITLSMILVIFCLRLGVYYMSDSYEKANLIYYYCFFWQQ